MNYWVIIDRNKLGPLSLEETRRLPLHADTFVWHRGLSVWTPAAEVAELADLFTAPKPSAPVSDTMSDAEAEEELLVSEAEEVEQSESSAPLRAEEQAEAGSEAMFEVEQDESAAELQEEPQPAPRPLPPPPPPPSVPYVQPPARREPKPPTYLGWSIAAIICCCLITGVIAVIYAARVTPCYDRGDYEGARKASERAELWLIISITAGIVALPFQMVLAML